LLVLAVATCTISGGVLQLVWALVLLAALLHVGVFPRSGAADVLDWCNESRREACAALYLRMQPASHYTLGGNGDLKVARFEKSGKRGSPSTLVCYLESVDTHLQNFMGSLHGGATATIVDQATTAALVADGAFPGVSVSLGVHYTAGCLPGAKVRVEAKVTKRGATMAFTECKLYREKDGCLMAHATHVKQVRPPLWWQLFASVRPSLIGIVASRFLDIDTLLKAPSWPKVTRVEAPYDKELEPVTGLPRSDTGKRVYFAHLGDGKYPMQGFDSPLQGALKANSPPPAAPAAVTEVSRGVVWELDVQEAHTNAAATLHGGCTAAIIDVLGTSIIAQGDPNECGVAIHLDVQYSAPASVGECIVFKVSEMKRGKRLVFIEAQVQDQSGRVVATGTVTKSLRGPIPAPK